MSMLYLCQILSQSALIVNMEVKWEYLAIKTHFYGMLEEKKKVW